MVWIIFLGVWMILGIGMSILFKEEEIKACGVFFGFLLPLLILICIIWAGLTRHIDLSEQREKIKTSEEDYQRVKSSYYDSFVGNKGNLIGDIANQGQSKALTDYVVNLNSMKQQYNSELLSCKLKMNSKLYWWFTKACIFNKKEIEKLERF